MWGGAFFPFQADLGILQFKGGADGAERLPQVGDVALHAAGGLVGAHVFDVSGDNGGDGGLGGQRVVVAAIKRRLQLPDLFLGQPLSGLFVYSRNEKGTCKICKSLICLVAGRGFEPLTFGL